MLTLIQAHLYQARVRGSFHSLLQCQLPSALSSQQSALFLVPLGHRAYTAVVVKTESDAKSDAAFTDANRTPPRFLERRRPRLEMRHGARSALLLQRRMRDETPRGCTGW